MGEWRQLKIYVMNKEELRKWRKENFIWSFGLVSISSIFMIVLAKCVQAIM